MSEAFRDILSSLPRHALLVGILGSCLASASILFGLFANARHASLVSRSDKPEQLLESLRSLTSEERAHRLAAEVDHLVSEPLSVEVINNIALLEALEEKARKSESISLEAARRSLRDTQSQLSAVKILLRKGEFDGALHHIDGLIRSQPELQAQLFDILAQLQSDPAALVSVAQLMKTDPIWRGEYLGNVFQDDVNGQVGFHLLSAIRKVGGVVSTVELQQYIGSQIEKKNFDIAYFTWIDSLTEDDLRRVSLLYDGKFDRTPRGQYFDWTVRPYPNGNISVVQKPGDPNNQVLQMDFEGGRDAFAHVYQYLRLAPGEYEVTGEWSAENFRSPSGLQWQVYCIGGAASSPPSRPLGTSSFWEKFSFSVSVPVKGCETQLLVLQSLSSAALDQRFEGQMYFDNIALASKVSTSTKSGVQ